VGLCRSSSSVHDGGGEQASPEPYRRSFVFSRSRGSAAGRPAGFANATGPYQLQAAIVACHAEAKRWQDTGWEQIVVMNDMLLVLTPSPVVRLHRAIALRNAAGLQAAMNELEALDGVLDEYYMLHATRAEVLRELGHHDHARAADRGAPELTANHAEQAVLEQRLAWT
jgi:predicted RNA polymerase sigma factor